MVPSQDALDLQDLRLSTSLALEIIDADDTVVEAEVCVSWCEQLTGNIRYTTEQPDDAVQPARSSTVSGIGILVVMDAQDGRHVGFGSEPDDLSLDGMRQALEQAKLSAVSTPAFDTLPRPENNSPAGLTFHDPDVLSLPLEDLTQLSAEALDGVLSTLQDAGFVTRIEVQGSVRSRTEHLMLGNTHGLMACETTTGLLAALMAGFAHEPSQGTSQGVATHLDDFSPYDTGVETANRLLQSRGGIVLDSGEYPVILGPEAMGALVQDLLLPALCLDTAAAGSSPFTIDSLGQPIAASGFTLTDEGRLPRRLGSRLYTGDGLPTGATPLIEQGRLTGFLADAYHARAMSPPTGAFAPRNGMRHHLRHRSYDMRPGIFPTNAVLSSAQAVDAETFIAAIDDGVYIGGLWATTPQGNPQQDNFSSTIIGPSYRIQHGQRTTPLRAGTMRVQGNLRELLQDITGISTDPQPVALPTLQSLVLSPAVQCRRIRLLT
ncbi:MAG: TldD/PmbA family protein [Candidatus Tectomicrobia bacterium]|nr:TldD/PmbA family protein [Candidatus Tectomicrobia bacterium]